MKFCKSCQQSKEKSCFHKDKSAKDGLSYVCKTCAIEKSRIWYKEHKEYASERSKEYNKTHSKENTAKAIAWAKSNPEKRFAIHRKWYEKNKEQKKVKDKIRYELMKPHILELCKLYMRKRRKIPKHHIASSISRSINHSLRTGKNGRSWETLVGYNCNDLMKHLEKQFAEGMSWDNYGKHGWHIDHKIPISAFNFETPEHIDFKRCWALDNLQPMWAVENIQKYNKLDIDFQPSLQLSV